MNLKTFKQGVHPPELKQKTEEKQVERPPLPQEVYIPLNQHIGSPCQPVVEKGEEVKTGQVIGEGEGFVTSTIHASISGEVKEIGQFPAPDGTTPVMVHIESDEKDTKIKDWKEEDWHELDIEVLKNRIAQAGIVGLGGASFPTQVKVSPPEDKSIDTYIVNGCECEPYLTADHRIMLEFSDKLLQGIQIMQKILGVKNVTIGIEDNKSAALELLREKTQQENEISVQALETKYPQGAEKNLIDALLDRKVPAGGLPLDVGVVVNNVGTIVATRDAVIKNKPLIERVVTVTGQGIQEPKNVIARIGTQFKHLIEYCGGLTPDTKKVIDGGPMMGVAQHTLDVPLTKGTSGILALTQEETEREPEYNCIRCGACVKHCPMNLLPTRIVSMIDNDYIEKAEELGALNCMECGSCAYVCPSNIPLVQKIKVGKQLINDRD